MPQMFKVAYSQEYKEHTIRFFNERGSTPIIVADDDSDERIASQVRRFLREGYFFELEEGGNSFGAK